MQGRDFIFSIQDDKYNFYKVDSAGVVSKSSKPYFLNFAPVGWQDIVIKNVRNQTYWGVDRSVSNSLSYVEDGSAIIKYIFYTLGIEEPAYLSISSQRLDYDKVLGSINISTLLPAENNLVVTGDPGSIVYVKFTPSTTDDVSIYIQSPVSQYYTFWNSLLNGDSKIIPISIPDTGQATMTLQHHGDNISMTVVNRAGTTTPTYGFWYKQVFRSQIDFTTFEHSGSQVKCNCLEDGLPKYLKANENTVFEYPMEVADAIWVKMDGVNMHDGLTYQDVSQINIGAGTYGRNFYGPCAFLNSEGDSTGVFNQTETLERESDTFSTRMASTNVLITNSGTTRITVRIFGTIEIKINNVDPFGAGIKFGFINSLTDALNEYSHTVMSLPSLGISSIGKTYTQGFDITVGLDPNESLFRGGQFNDASDVDTAFEFTENSQFTIQLITRYQPTYVRHFTAQYLFGKLIDSVTESNLKAALCSYFDKYKNIVFTSANAIRNIPGATMKINLTDFFKFWNSFDSVGIQLTAAGVILDRKQNLIDTINIIDLPEVVSRSLKVSLDKSYLFNEVHFGYPSISSDVGVLNANEEANDTMIFSLGTTSSPAVLDKVSPIRAMPYEIEKIRITQVGQDTTSYPTDNNNYVLAVENTLQPASGTIPAYYNLDRSLNASATGILEPATIFNLALTPKRMFNNNGSDIRSSLYKSDSKVFKFISSDKNNKLVCGGVTENADVTVGSLDAPFFYPVLLTADINVPDDMEDKLDESPLQIFRFPFEGTMYVGICNTVSLAPSSRATQNFQLLSVPENQLQNLIDYYG